jgi:hypothetical protein
VLAFEESATDAGTTLIKVWIPSQGTALCKVAQGSMEEGRVMVEVGGWAELVQAKPGGWPDDGLWLLWRLSHTRAVEGTQLQSRVVRVKWSPPTSFIT